GNDIIYGYGGDDEIHGGTGDDLIFGNDGSDQIFGDDGNDTLLGLDKADILHGGNGNDVLVGGDGDDQLFGDAGNDILWGGVEVYDRSHFDLTNPANFTTPPGYLEAEADPKTATGYVPATVAPGVTWIMPAVVIGASIEGQFTDGKDMLRGGDDTDWLFGGGDTDDLDGEN